MNHNTRIYTRTGDEGMTRLVGGQKIPKTNLRISAYGSVDELNASIGLARALLETETGEIPERLCETMTDIQRRLFDLGTELACLPEDVTDSTPRIRQETVDAIEAEIDELEECLPRLTRFVLPSGGTAAAAIQIARTVCRRSEVSILELHDDTPVRAEALCYINRLSDYLFVAARAAAKASGSAELTWSPAES